MESNRLQIRRHRVEYLVPAEHPSPEQVKTRLDKTLTQQLEGTLLSAFSSWFSAGDQSIWCVRRLDIDLAVNASWSGEHVTRAFTMQIGRTLGETLHDSTESENVVHFPSREAYLSRFLYDLAVGDAWSRWYYESFAGLRLLPTSAALRTSICDESEPGAAAILQLSAGELLDVLRVLSRIDAQLILDNLAAQAPAGDEADCCRMAWNAWQTVAPSLFNRLDESRRALLLYLTASRDQEKMGLNLKRAALSLIRLQCRLSEDPASERERLLAALTGDNLAEFYRVAGGDAELLAPLLRCPAEWLNEVAEAINDRQPKRTSDDSSKPGRRHTSFGGAFLLLPFINDLPLAEATRGWPQTNEAAAISLARWLLLVKCCGEVNAPRSFNDPLLRDLLLIPPAASVETVREWASRIVPADIKNFVRTILDEHRKPATTLDHKLILTRTVFKEDRLLVLIDGNDGHWLRAQTYEQSELVPALHESLADLTNDDGVLFCEPSLLEDLWAEFPSVKVISFMDVSSEEEQVNCIIRRLDRLPDEFAHFALPVEFQLSLEFDLSLSVCAQHVMRGFSSRLNGFALSNAPYLWSNFLDFSAGVDEEDDRRVVLLGRPPLRLVLGLSGLTRQSYNLSWLDERPLSLFEET